MSLKHISQPDNFFNSCNTLKNPDISSFIPHKTTLKNHSKNEAIEFRQ